MKRLLRSPRAMGLVAALVMLAGAAAFLWAALPRWATNGVSAATYVGVQGCVGCHASEEGAWRQSHHAEALAKPTEQAVRADFNDTAFDYDGVVTRFHRTKESFLVDTDDASGTLREFPVAFTIGVFPLQQFLLPGADGALQALNVVWDARPREQGGQHWFHLHPGENVGHDSVLHWTAPSQNWNFMCADCHSTHLEKNYDATNHRFATRWSDIDVACEACHGPGSSHVRWARWASLPLIGRLAGTDPALQLRFKERVRPGRLAQVLDPSTSLSFTPGVEVQACAQCHSRRSQLTNAYVPREGYANHYKPELISEPLYYIDGQMRDEVYESGSFQQSRMFAKGVTCSDCHDPHTAKLRAPGNALCLQCHARRYDAPSHTFHEDGSNGSQCVNCHMPSRNYMVIDARRDHSIRVPRPDLTVSLGVPNACNACHTDKSAQWAEDEIERRYGHQHRGLQQFAEQLDAIRSQSSGAEDAIRDLLVDPKVPDVIKATALSESGPYLQNGISEALHLGVSHANPTVRLGALQALDDAPSIIRWQYGAALLDDPSRSVRIEAARILGASSELTGEQQRMLAPSWAEFVAAVDVNADRAEWHALYAAALSARGEVQTAIQELQMVIKLNPRLGSAYLNLADAYRQAGRENLCENTLADGLAVDSGNAALHAALGLSMVRRQRMTDAVKELGRARTLDPGNGSYTYLYAAALRSQDHGTARRVLVAALTDSTHRHDRSELFLLIQVLLDQGDRKGINVYLPELRALAVNDPQARSLLERIETGP